MNKLLRISVLVISCLFATQLTAHHSFAIYDFETQVPFDGVVETLKFRNPHISMTLKVINENGEEVIVDFIEGAPANMMVRNGIKPDQMKPGSKVHAVGSPLIENPSKFFLRSIRTEDGSEYSN
ncbi:MAG: DUF6152 family protein [Gammaproteobacteria bacterium]|nr:DUF6152 family protein [Gammaproteobacteria bacterium]